MWIVSLAVDSHEMPSLIFSEKKKKKNDKKFRLLSAIILLSALLGDKLWSRPCWGAVWLSILVYTIFGFADGESK